MLAGSVGLSACGQVEASLEEAGQDGTPSNAPQFVEGANPPTSAERQELTAPCVFSRRAIVTDFREAGCDINFDPTESECGVLSVKDVNFNVSPLVDPRDQPTGVFLDRSPLMPFYEDRAEGDDVALTMELQSSHYFHGDEVMQFGGNGQLFVFIDNELVVSQDAGARLSETTVDLRENGVEEGLHEVSIFFARQGDIRPEFFATLPVTPRECPAPSR